MSETLDAPQGAPGEGRIAVENPATGETLATVPELGAEQVAAMAEKARAVQPDWWAAGFEGRAEVLLAARAWLVENGEQVVGTICAETGRPGGELHDTPGVWVGDGSAFPTASGTNPMATIMALARRTAHAIANPGAGTP